MKTRLYFSVLVFSLMAMMSSCKKETTGPDPDENATIKSSLVPTNPVYGGSAIISWNVIGTCGKFLVIYGGDTISKDCTGSYELKNLTEPCTVDFVCVLLSNGRTVKGSQYVPVGSAPVPPTLTITCDTSTVPFMGSKVISWTSSTNTDSVLDSKNQNVGKSGSIQIGGLIKDTTITRKAINSAGFDIKSVTVKVAPKPILTRIDSLFGSWLLVDKLNKSQSSTQFISNIISCERDDFTIFMSVMTTATTYKFELHQGPVWCCCDSELFGNGDWSLSQDGTKLNMDGLVYDITLEGNTLTMLCTDFVGGFNKLVYTKI